MSESNGGITLEDHEQRLRRLEAARKEVEDALVVMAHLESKAAERVKEHAQFIAEHQASIEQQRRSGEEVDRRIQALVSAIGNLLARIPPSALADKP